MNSIDPELWGRLDQAQPVGGQLMARAGVPDLTERVLCAFDSQRHRHLLIPLTSDDSEFRDAQSRGLMVSTRELMVRGQPAAPFLDMECHDAGGYAVFDLIGSELAQELAQPGRQATDVLRRVLARWRRFWGQIPRTMLSRDALLGLFGELWFFHVWLRPHLSPVEAIQRWRGPFGSRHDFEWPGKSVEVKATTSTRGRIHRIHGIEQLQGPEQGELLFFSIRLREEGGASNTLPGLIALCRDTLDADPEALSRFETALAQAGYSPAHDEEYAKIRLRLVEEGLYRVTAGFPRVTIQSFSTGVPAGVEMLEYEINLNTYDHLSIAAAAEQARAYLR